MVNTLKNNDRFAKKVLDVRNWYQFAVEEYNYETLEQIRFYKDSGAISGGQKAKLAYTILAAAIAHQFDVFNFDNSARSFRFVIVDEALVRVTILIVDMQWTCLNNGFAINGSYSNG